MKKMSGISWVVIMAGAMIVTLAVACGRETEVVEVEKVVVVEKEVVVEREVVKEVPVEVVIEKEVMKEVPIETVMIKEVPVEKIVEKIVEVEKRVPVEVVVEKEVVKTIEIEKPVIVEVERPVIIKEEVVKTIEVPVEKIVEKIVIVTPVPAAPVMEKDAVQYGGTLSSIHRAANFPVSGWDPISFNLGATAYTWPAIETMLGGGIDQYGPRGTSKSPFTMDFPPLNLVVGELAESWELGNDPISITYHIRPGVMFTGSDHIDMEPREYTADDAVFVLQRFLDGPVGGLHFYVEKHYAQDKYTHVIELNQPYADWPWRLGYFIAGGQYAREGADAPGGMDDWRNLVGTGPFTLTEYVADSVITMERNPNYWGTTTIDGKEYELPFLDKLIQPIIPDPAVQITALRTGNLDMHINVPLRFEKSLQKTVPDLVKRKYLSQTIMHIPLNNNSEYFSNRDIRRALAIGTDREAVIAAIYGEGEADSYIFNSDSLPSVYVPVEEMPDSTRLLYQYNPELAEQMIADAGYPDGFSIELAVQSSPSMWQDAAQLLAGMWKKIGIKTELIVMEPTQLGNLVSSHEYKDAFLTENSSGPSLFTGFLLQGLRYNEDGSDHWWNSAEFEDSAFDKAFLGLQGEMDLDKLGVGLREWTLYLKDAAPYLSLGAPLILEYNWPWVKNWYGENTSSWQNMGPIFSRIWIDQDLKGKMGY